MKKCLIVVNTHKDESQNLGRMIQSYLAAKSIESSVFCFDGFSTENPFTGFDFVITLGGDGTVLFAARGCVKNKIPVFPVNLGEFGFIASIQKNEWQKELDLFLAGKSEVDERNMLNAALVSTRQSEPFSGIGLNDVVICAKTAARTIMFTVSYNDVPLGTFKADGIIISTATGSTAYSASAGGPIIDPELDALVLTPINSFSLSSRPLVLSPKGEVGITILPSRENDVIITIDGQKPFDLHEGDCIKIRRLQEKVKLVGCTTKKFYGALCSKLNWSGGPHA
ncbi:MAG: NAD(+)/NADH kinase [Treponema porcinum]|uniref:NAD(+)/NADH kinase n=1 Tax=Treponema porcinum TaxID=261392 RepID=UPI0023570DC0|nr:NAD(+)/NADH kinase [Treponema porcinum]MCI6480776.1 NAD(+)/NADH kinase [Treponema porcinum]MCI6984116.1 NAD(+)/NADH kinase [Treponema porcinum]MCI7079479.1 NAD(+)/NADH kinase [Treponema porcinum]MCI7534240.1 NAD(+)/NADH kinase [Treponema porcinum]MCI7546676.1 NAD(+)/NADH kinase [Treponema porcinum]